MPPLTRAETGLQAARLPGIRFETVPSRRPSVLPRMDIPVFAGFASRGPLHVPVPVEDAVEFLEVFGADQPLAWDSERGRSGYAHLGATVRLFFRNGGRRCWVVRVADEYTAHTAYFPLAGMASFDGADLQPAFVPARSPGSWGEALQVSTALLTQPVAWQNFDPDAHTLDLQLEKPGAIVAGDVLRLSFDSDGWFALFPVASVAVQSNDPAPSLDQARSVTLGADRLFWFRPASAQAPGVQDGEMFCYTHTASAPASSLPALPFTIPADTWPVAASPAEALSGDNDVLFDVEGTLDPAYLSASAPGCLVRLAFSDGSLFWMLVSSQVANDTQPSVPGSGEYERFGGTGLWQVDSEPDTTTFSDPSPRIELLTFELANRTASGRFPDPPQRLSGLGFSAGHPRFWAALPDDQDLYTTQANLTTGDASYPDSLLNTDYLSSTTTRAVEPYASLWQSARTPRFALAGDGQGLLFLPLLVPALPVYTTPDEPSGDTLARDGLASFNAGLFLDPALADQFGDALLGTADDLRYLRPNPRALRGIYAALSVEEATLIAAPDGVHNQWEKGLLDPLPPAEPSLPPERPVWWRFLPCNPPPAKLPRTSQPEWGEFLRCGLRIIPAPVLSASTPDANGTFTLTWTAVADITRYVLEESAFPDFRLARPIYTGPLTGWTLYGYSEGDYYFRVRAEAVSPVDGLVETSDYSNGVGLRIAPNTTWIFYKDQSYDPTSLLLLQRCLLRLAAARGDLFAVLSLPHHLRATAAIQHVQALRSPLADALAASIPNVDLDGSALTVSVLPLSYGEERSLGFGAVYHPWLVVTDDQLTSTSSSTARPVGTASAATATGLVPASTALVPPDGGTSGVIARRSFERGAWIAPANQKFSGVVGLQPVISPADWLDLQEAHLNLVRDEPQGYLVLSANTLSADPDWKLINVRRLISLLRRLAQRYGPGYVFEPNSAAFRRQVQREFSALLGQMFTRGAFAGDTPATSYQVNVIATPQDIDEGRVTIELRVAPSVPLRFILVRLVQSGDQSAVTEQVGGAAA